MGTMKPSHKASREAPPVGIVLLRPERASHKISALVGWIVAENGCHIWQGAQDGWGYGVVRENGRVQKVHRLRYEREFGPVPDDLVMDHFACDNRLCCNPAHVRPVTERENLFRSDSASAWHASRTHCPQGHEYSGDNLYVNPNTGWRLCKECGRAASRVYSRARRARETARRRALRGHP